MKISLLIIVEKVSCSAELSTKNFYNLGASDQTAPEEPTLFAVQLTFLDALPRAVKFTCSSFRIKYHKLSVT